LSYRTRPLALWLCRLNCFSTGRNCLLILLVGDVKQRKGHTHRLIPKLGSNAFIDIQIRGDADNLSEPLHFLQFSSDLRHFLHFLHTTFSADDEISPVLNLHFQIFFSKTCTDKLLIQLSQKVLYKHIDFIKREEMYNYTYIHGIDLPGISTMTMRAPGVSSVRTAGSNSDSIPYLNFLS